MMRLRLLLISAAAASSQPALPSFVASTTCYNCCAYGDCLDGWSCCGCGTECTCCTGSTRCESSTGPCQAAEDPVNPYPPAVSSEDPVQTVDATRTRTRTHGLRAEQNTTAESAVVHTTDASSDLCSAKFNETACTRNNKTPQCTMAGELCCSWCSSSNAMHQLCFGKKAAATLNDTEWSCAAAQDVAQDVSTKVGQRQMTAAATFAKQIYESQTMLPPVPPKCPTGPCGGFCDHYVAYFYGLPSSGHASAFEHWSSIPAAKHYTGWRPGALAFFSGGSKGYGHIAIGDVSAGMVYTTDLVRGKDKDGYVGHESIAAIESLWGLHFLGWTQPMF